MEMISPQRLHQLQLKWQEMLNTNEEERIKRIICIDGKTMRSNKRKGLKPTHIVSAWIREDGYCLGQKAIDEKGNEITAIPELLEIIEIKGQIVTIDAMGTQTAIVEKIKKKQADYVLALKGNQGNLYGDVKLYLSDPEIKRAVQHAKNYKKTIEKAHGQIEIRDIIKQKKLNGSVNASIGKG